MVFPGEINDQGCRGFFRQKRKTLAESLVQRGFHRLTPGIYRRDFFQFFWP